MNALAVAVEDELAALVKCSDLFGWGEVLANLLRTRNTPRLAWSVVACRIVGKA